MICLSETLRHWALDEPDLSASQRTELMLWSADYEAIALFRGLLWKATQPEHPPPITTFIARLRP